MRNFSIAMAVYNGEKFIDQQIQSILPQMKEFDELIISYDHSEDNTLNIVNDYAKHDHRIKVIINPNPGLFSNFENALRKCQNELVFISDQDDIWKSNKCQVILAEFEHNNVDMVIHNGYHFNTETMEKSKDFFSLYNIKKGILKNFLKPRYSGCCMAFKKELLQVILPIPENIGGYDHWIGMLGEIYGNIYFCDKILIEHRLHNSNFTPTNRRGLGIVILSRTHLLIEILKRKQLNFGTIKK